MMNLGPRSNRKAALPKAANVAIGSLADICSAIAHGRFGLTGNNARMAAMKETANSGGLPFTQIFGRLLGLYAINGNEVVIREFLANLPNLLIFWRMTPF